VCSSDLPSRRTGVNVGAWLHGLGLGQYEQAFHDNNVDARVLPGLTADDLKEIGVYEGQKAGPR